MQKSFFMEKIRGKIDEVDTYLRNILSIARRKEVRELDSLTLHCIALLEEARREIETEIYRQKEKERLEDYLKGE